MVTYKRSHEHSSLVRRTVTVPSSVWSPRYVSLSLGHNSPGSQTLRCISNAAHPRITMGEKCPVSVPTYNFLFMHSAWWITQTAICICYIISRRDVMYSHEPEGHNTPEGRECLSIKTGIDLTVLSYISYYSLYHCTILQHSLGPLQCCSG